MAALRIIHAAAGFDEQAQDFKIQPDQRDHQAKRDVPLLVVRRADTDARIYEMKIEHMFERRDTHDKNAEADSDRARSIGGREMDAEEAKHNFDNVEERDAARRGNDAEANFFSDGDQAREAIMRAAK